MYVRKLDLKCDIALINIDEAFRHEFCFESQNYGFTVFMDQDTSKWFTIGDVVANANGLGQRTV